MLDPILSLNLASLIVIVVGVVFLSVFAAMQAYWHGRTEQSAHTWSREYTRAFEENAREVMRREIMAKVPWNQIADVIDHYRANLPIWDVMPRFVQVEEWLAAYSPHGYKNPMAHWRLHMQYRKKPVVIEAFRYGSDPRPDWFVDKVTRNEIVTHPTHCEIHTLEGVMRGETGDWIIRGVKGEIYPCKPDIFEATYELVSSSSSQEGG